MIGIQHGACAEGRGQSRIKRSRNRTLDHRGERNSPVPLEKTGDAPAARDLVKRPVKCKLAPVTERQLVDDLTDHGIGGVKVRQTIIGCRACTRSGRYQCPIRDRCRCRYRAISTSRN